MSRYRSTFVRGVFFGCLGGTLMLIASSLFFRGLSLSFETGGTNGELLAEGRSLLSLEGLGLPSALGNDEEEVTTKDIESYEKEQAPPMTYISVRDSNEQKSDQPKKPFLTLVTTTKSLLERTSNRIRTSWGSVEGAEYRIVVGMEAIPSLSIVDMPEVILSTGYHFPAFPYLSLSNLSALLELITENFIDDYNWFLLAPSNVYVSVQSLERFLQRLNPYKVVYVGRPSNYSMPNERNYCEGGPGIVLSHMAVRKLRRRLEGCIRNSKGDLGYRELGKCLISELKTECFVSEDISLEDYFIHDQKFYSLNHDELTRKSEPFQHMLTLYPVYDQQHLNIIHAFNQAREITAIQDKVRLAETKLQKDGLCHESMSDCRLPVVSNTNIHGLLAHCQFHSRGYIAEMRRKVEHWDTVTGHTLYNSWNLSPQELVYGALSKELTHITDAAVSVARADAPELQLVNVANLYVRYRGTVGREFMLDLELNGSEGEVVEKRVSLLLPHANEFSMHVGRTESTLSRVNFIIPMNGLNRKKTAKFQRNFYTLCVRRTENCRVIYIMYSSNSDVNFMRTYLTRFKRRHSKFMYEYIVGKGKFNRTEAYNLGLAKLNGSELAFIASADVSLADHFLPRCRSNTIAGTQLYYPELFMYYNMPYVYRGKWHPRHYDYSRLHGRWTTRSVMCIYKSDYASIGGYDTFKRWELDPSLMKAAPMEVFIAPDPGISHWYEPTHCDSKLPPDQFSRCLSMRSDNLADRLSLAGYLLSLENKCSQG